MRGAAAQSAGSTAKPLPDDPEKLLDLLSTPGACLFDRFEVIRPLGRSCSGAVLLCSEPRRRGRLLAVKTALTERAESDILSLGLEREYLIGNTVVHPNVVRSEELLKAEKYLGYSMEYLGGGTLSDQLGQGALPLEKVFSVLLQVSRGLAALHNAGVVHRDVKPENILVGFDGTLKIADFGIALVPGFPNILCSAHLVGTVDYLAPEYVESGVSDGLSDIFALGVIGYQMLTGRLPYDGATLIDRLTCRVTSDPRPPHTLRAGCPRPLSEVIMTALARDPLQRFQTTGELVAHLEVLSHRLGRILHATDVRETAAAALRSRESLLTDSAARAVG